jgi:hypothetical protein
MSVQDEHELRDRLDGLLAGIEPGLPPVAATMRRGRGIRMRRWISMAAGVAVLAAGAVALPALLGVRSAAPIASRQYKVTVTPIGPGARPGLIGQGTTDGHRWTAIMTDDGHGNVTLSGRGLSGFISYQDFATQFVANPAALDASGSSGSVLEFGTVRADVTQVVISLPDGEVISLSPVSWHNRRWVAVMLPAGVPIVRAVLYTNRGELAYAVPFRAAELATWWQPGEAGPAPLTKTIGSGFVDGKPWRTTAYVGPWGYCYVFSSGQSCFDTTINPGLVSAGTFVSSLSCESTGGQASDGLAATAPSVRRVVVTFADGSTATFPTYAVGAARMFGYAISRHQKVVGSREYGASGQLLHTTSGKEWAC